jgi:plasmid maintenance system antidote protein VapI
VTPDPSRIPLHVTPDQLAKCIETHRRELANIIRNQHTAPIDGGVMRIVAALDALERIDPTEK